MVFGRLLGMLFGASLGGGFGAMLGLYLGYQFDKGLDNHMAQAPQATVELQRVFFESAFAVMGYIAKADGRVNEQEIQAARRIMEQLQLNEAQKLEAMRQFNLGKEPNFQLEPALSQLRQATQSYWPLLRLFMELQFQAAYADGPLNADERLRLEHMGKQLGLSAMVIQQMDARFRAEHSFHNQQRSYEQEHAHWSSHHKSQHHHQHRQQQSKHDNHQHNAQHNAQYSLQASYDLLGVPATADLKQIKTAYRKLMSEHHPDKMIARGLPPQMVRLATEKVQAIQNAYETVMKARGEA